VTDRAPTFPTEEYIAGRERGRTAGLKRTRKSRLIAIAAFVFLGGPFVCDVFASPAATGRHSFSFSIALPIFFAFVILGVLACLKAMYSYRRSIANLRDDIVRSVMTPDEATPQPGRFGKWWLKGDASGAPAWDRPAGPFPIQENPDEVPEPR
jgi:hypothetical protein